VWVVSLVAAFVAAPPVEAQIRDHTGPVVHARALSDGAWTAVRMSVAAKGYLETSVDLSVDDSTVTAFGMWLVLPGGGTSSGVGLLSGGEERVRIEAPGGTVIDRDTTPEGSGGVEISLSIPVEPGNHVLIVAVASDGPSTGHLKVRADPGTEVLGATDGSGTFLYRDPDFSRSACAYLATGGAQVRAMARCTVSETAGHQLFAQFLDLNFGAPPALLSYDPPNAPTKGPDQFHVITHGAPGSYTFRVDAAANVDVDLTSTVVLLGADVSPPA
jgi:hypothetical protein